MKIDRLLGILTTLLQKEQVTAPYLAEKFEVSRRTISRDIDTLCQAGIPLVTTQGKHGGISIMAGYRLDCTLLTSTDLQAIFTGLRSLDSICGTNQYELLMDKLRIGSKSMLPLNHHILIDLSSWRGNTLTEQMTLLQNAIAQHKYITLSYCAPGGDSVRTVEPYLLVFHWSSWYLWSYCTEKQSFRLFRLSRIMHLQSLDTTFVPQEVPPPKLDDTEIFASGQAVKIRFDANARWRLLDDIGMSCFTVQPDGSLLAEFDFMHKNELFHWLLSFGDYAELLEPASLRQEFAQQFCRLAKKYL